MIGMRLSPHVELDVTSQRVTKGLTGSVATGHGADVNVSEDIAHASVEPREPATVPRGERTDRPIIQRRTY